MCDTSTLDGAVTGKSGSQPLGTADRLSKWVRPPWAEFLCLTRSSNSQRLVEAESQNRLHRYLDGALGQNLGHRARARAGAGADGRAFAATGDGADDGPHCRRTAAVFRRALVESDPGLAPLFERNCMDLV